MKTLDMTAKIKAQGLDEVAEKLKEVNRLLQQAAQAFDAVKIAVSLGLATEPTRDTAEESVASEKN